jgi:TonB family protein
VWDYRLIFAIGVLLAVASCGAAGDPGRPRSADTRASSDATERTCNGQAPWANREFSYAADVVPHRVHYVAPEYPKEAARTGIRGVVILRAVIDAKGIVRQTRIIRSAPMFDDAAAVAVCSWRFTPAAMGGTAIPVAMTVSVEFPPAPH